MKTVVAVTVLAAVLAAGVAQGAQPPSSRAEQAAYRVTVLPSPDGTSRSANSINDRGWVTGQSTLPGDRRGHAILWRDGARVDLGTLGGPNSSVAWPVKNNQGIVSGIAQTAHKDPLGERWSCSAFFPAATATGHQCLGFRWRAGVMHPLPTLGGTNGFATGTNDRGQTVGWAENRVHDASCVAPQVLQFRAVVWGRNPRHLRALPPLPGDTVSAATALNDHGQVVGISGYCDQAVGRYSAIHAVLWQHGKPTSLGTLGGVAWNTPMSINQRGDVVGFANASAADGGDFNPRAFLWTPTSGIRHLRTLPGEATSQALAVNDRREVVGTSCDADGNCRAVLWRNGTSIDLNRLIGRHPRLVLTSANDINDAGHITGQALDTRTGQYVAFTARPRP